jgi:hypothetical protein
VSFGLDFLAPGTAVQPIGFNAYFIAGEYEPADRHLVDHGVQPVDQQQFEVRRLAFEADGFEFADGLRVGHHRGERERGLLEGLRRRAPHSMHADIGVVREVIPAHPCAGGSMAHPSSVNPIFMVT